MRRHLLHRPLPVGRRVADVLLLRRVDVGETAAQRRDDLGRLVDGERCLSDVRNLVRVQVQPFGVLDRLDENDRVGRLAHRADDLLVAFVPDEHDGVAVRGVAPRLDVHLRDERARRVDRLQPSIG